jgi:quercetin dioxygenase-like cupin family protein
MLVLEGEIKFQFENSKKTTVKSGECFVLPGNMKHRCLFRELTVAIEGVYEKGL